VKTPTKLRRDDFVRKPANTLAYYPNRFKNKFLEKHLVKIIIGDNPRIGRLRWFILKFLFLSIHQHHID